MQEQGYKLQSVQAGKGPMGVDIPTFTDPSTGMPVSPGMMGLLKDFDFVKDTKKFSLDLRNRIEDASDEISDTRLKVKQIMKMLDIEDPSNVEIRMNETPNLDKNEPNVSVSNKVSSIGGKSSAVDTTPIDPRVSNESIRVAQVTSTVAV